MWLRRRNKKPTRSSAARTSRPDRSVGIGGTQDIAMIGTIVFLVLTLATIVIAIAGHLFARR